MARGLHSRYRCFLVAIEGFLSSLWRLVCVDGCVTAYAVDLNMRSELGPQSHPQATDTPEDLVSMTITLEWE